MNNEIELKLTINEVNVVLGALGNMPFAQVATLIEKVKGQAQPQVDALSATAQ